MSARGSFTGYVQAMRRVNHAYVLGLTTSIQNTDRSGGLRCSFGEGKS